MTRHKKSQRKHVVHGHVLMPALDVIRIVENDCAGGQRGEHVASLFTLYQLDELDARDRSRFERLIKTKGTDAEKDRLENFKKQK